MMALADSITSRRGVAVIVALIIPVLYSPLITSTASTATIAWPSRTPVRLVFVVSAEQVAGHLTMPTVSALIPTRQQHRGGQQPGRAPYRPQLGPLRVRIASARMP